MPSKQSHKIKLIVSDVDGTFLPKSRTITEATGKVLRELTECNIAVVLVSSRPSLGMYLTMSRRKQKAN